MAFLTPPPYPPEPWRPLLVWVNYFAVGIGSDENQGQVTERLLASSLRLELGLPADFSIAASGGYALRTFEEEPGAEDRAEGALDTIVEVQRQMLHERRHGISITLGLHSVLPTGSADEGFGLGSVGWGGSIALGRDFGRVFSYAWTSFTWFERVRGGPDRDESLHVAQFGLTTGVKLVMNARGEDEHELHALLELAASINSNIDPALAAPTPGRREGLRAVAIAPGIRYGLWSTNGHQLSLGLAVPIGLTREALDWGLIAHFEFDY